jgi:hypothetical protein
MRTTFSRKAFSAGVRGSSFDRNCRRKSPTSVADADIDARLQETATPRLPNRNFLRIIMADLYKIGPLGPNRFGQRRLLRLPV